MMDYIDMLYVNEHASIVLVDFDEGCHDIGGFRGRIGRRRCFEVVACGRQK